VPPPPPAPPPQPPTLDLLALFPHPDDAELTCGGTLHRAAKHGHRVGIVDLARGEMASRGDPALRAAEAGRAAAVLGVQHRETVGLPDTGIVNTPETRRVVAGIVRRLRPRVVLTTAPSPFGRHPDHRETAELVRDACFVAGLLRLEDPSPPHRPLKVLHSITYREDYLKPTFVVDISDELETKLAAIQCYASQFDGVFQAGEVYPNGDPLLEIIRHHAAHYGSLIRTRYGEPFHTTETMRVDDVATLGVSTF
jgi:bacillithiol biosynthesis deacetylase BshB1